MISDLLLVSIGNSRTRVARAKADGPIEPSRVIENRDEAALLGALVAAAQELDPETSRVLLASVNDAVALRVLQVLQAPDLPRVVRLVAPGGSGLAVPMQVDLPPPLTVGVDRLLAALGAHDRSRTACVVIDAGTAVTVDFVDEFGVFRGGVIAPGLAMLLRSLHQGTSALPALPSPRSASELPAGPMGKTTAEAMTLGCVASIVGLCHRMIDRYATAHGRYPRVVATGGDAPLLFENDDLVEAVVPDLILIGMQSAWKIGESGAVVEDEGGEE